MDDIPHPDAQEHQQEIERLLERLAQADGMMKINSPAESIVETMQTVQREVEMFLLRMNDQMDADARIMLIEAIRVVDAALKRHRRI